MIIVIDFPLLLCYCGIGWQTLSMHVHQGELEYLVCVCMLFNDSNLKQRIHGQSTSKSTNLRDL